MQKKIDFAQSIPAQMPPPTASSTGSASKSSVLFNQGGISQEKLMGITCMCEVEKNGFPDLEIRKKDKNKVLHVYRTTKQGERSTLKFALKFQKSGDNALEFYLRDIAGIISSNMTNGMMTMILNMRAKDDKGPQAPAIKPNSMIAG